MTTGERIKKLRKYFDLTQQKFGERIGIKGNTVAQYELGRNEPIDAVISLICKEFNVDEDWLRSGTGDVKFRKSNESDIMNMIDRIMSGENEFHKNLFKTFAQLDEKELSALESILDRFLKVQKSDSAALFSASDIPDTPEELERLCPPIEFGKDDAV